MGDISLNRLAVCECSDFNVCFVLEPFGVSDESSGATTTEVTTAVAKLIPTSKFSMSI